MLLIDFKDHVVKADRNRHLMAKIALNALGHPARYSVDVSDLRQLSEANRGVVNAFLDWAWSVDRRQPVELRWLSELRAIAEQELIYSVPKPPAA